MKLDNLLTSNSINLSSQSYNITTDGIKAAAKAKDLHHADKHVFTLFDELNKFLNNEINLDLSKINFDILIPAIAWHDVWKGSAEQTRSKIMLFFRDIYDGIGGKKTFDAYAKQEQVDTELKKEIGYAIKRHAKFEVFPYYKAVNLIENKLYPIKSTEARILRDLDGLDTWNQQRLDNLVDVYLNTKEALDPKLLKIAQWWFFNVTLKTSDIGYYFNYSKIEFKRRKILLIEAIIDLVLQAEKYIDINDEKYKKIYKTLLEKIEQTRQKVLSETCV